MNQIITKKQIVVSIIFVTLFFTNNLIFAENIDHDGDGSQYVRGENVGWITFRSTGIVPYGVATSWSTSELCESDFDEDADMDGSDLAVFAADFGRTDCKGSSDPCEGDFDEDGDVDGSDLAVFADLPLLVDYSDETGTITAIVDVTGTATTQVVTIDQNGNGVLTDDGDRIDVLKNVEEIVAASNSAGNDSILDLTASNQDVEISFQYNGIEGMITSRDLMENTVRIADGDSNSIDGVPSFIEYYDLDDDDDIAAFANATWNRVEGSDNAETIIYEGSENLVDEAGLDHRYSNDILTLRGGNNSVFYNNLETSITANVNVVEDTGSGDGLITMTVDFQDGNYGYLEGSKRHTITSYTPNNSIAAGTLKIGGSQNAKDTIFISSNLDKLYILGTGIWGTDVTISIDNHLFINLAGFEFFGDSPTDDTYHFKSISYHYSMNIVDNLTNDHDTIQVEDDAVAYQASPADTISLKDLNNELNFDFDFLDITNVTKDDLIIVGDTNVARDLNDDLVVGDLALIDDTQNFNNTLWLTDASVQSGNDSFILNVDSGKLLDENEDKYFDFDGDGLNLSMVTSGNIEIVAIDTTAAGVTLIGGAGNDDITGTAGDDLLIGDAGDDKLEVGTGGNNLFYGGQGVDEITGGAGCDTIIVIGEVGADDYTAADLAGTLAQALGETYYSAIINGNAISNVTTDSYDGDDGIDLLEIWGDADFSAATISDIEIFNIHSTVTLNPEQLAGSTVNIFDPANSVVNIVVDGSVDLIFGGDDGQSFDSLQDYVDTIPVEEGEK